MTQCSVIIGFDTSPPPSRPNRQAPQKWNSHHVSEFVNPIVQNATTLYFGLRLLLYKVEIGK